MRRKTISHKTGRSRKRVQLPVRKPRHRTQKRNKRNRITRKSVVRGGVDQLNEHNEKVFKILRNPGWNIDLKTSELNSLNFVIELYNYDTAESVHLTSKEENVPSNKYLSYNYRVEKGFFVNSYDHNFEILDTEMNLQDEDIKHNFIFKYDFIRHCFYKELQTGPTVCFHIGKNWTLEKYNPTCTSETQSKEFPKVMLHKRFKIIPFTLDDAIMNKLYNELPTLLPKADIKVIPPTNSVQTGKQQEIERGFLGRLAWMFTAPNYQEYLDDLDKSSIPNAEHVTGIQTAELADDGYEEWEEPNSNT